MGDVNVIGDVGAAIDLQATFQVADVGHLTDFTKVGCPGLSNFGYGSHLWLVDFGYAGVIRLGHYLGGPCRYGHPFFFFRFFLADGFLGRS
jgi:hypothetical protein